MELTAEQIIYEQMCKDMFVGKTIRAVIYGEVKYDVDDDGNNITPQPSYKTKYPDIDSLDHSIYFTTEDSSIYIFWDNTFVCYGLQSKQIDLTEETNNYEQRWDVSAENKWIDFIGQKIISFNIHWNGRDEASKTYPQTFEINTENGKSIFVTASELKEGEDEYYSQMDNILVTTNAALLKHLEEIELRNVEKVHYKNSIWAKIFGKKNFDISKQ